MKSKGVGQLTSDVHLLLHSSHNAARCTMIVSICEPFYVQGNHAVSLLCWGSSLSCGLTAHAGYTVLLLPGV